jgi:hypothetical protein
MVRRIRLCEIRVMATLIFPRGGGDSSVEITDEDGKRLPAGDEVSVETGLRSGSLYLHHSIWSTYEVRARYS